MDLQIFNLRTGIGYDVHAFGDGRKLILGGVEIPHTVGLKGHSDADVLIHAVIDSLLGASGYRDIGNLFPDSDNQYKGTASTFLLGRVFEKLNKANIRIINIDITVICQRPKLAPYIDTMRENISNILNIDETDRISIKATTSENLGFTGREEGIASVASALIYME